MRRSCVRSQRLPLGPLLQPRPAVGEAAKAIEEILATYPKLKFILSGDSGEEDPEVYSAVVHRHPDRIRAIYIRSVNQDPARLAAIRCWSKWRKPAASSCCRPTASRPRRTPRPRG
jgi:phosphatidate phosphatase APP1